MELALTPIVHRLSPPQLWWSDAKLSASFLQGLNEQHHKAGQERIRRAGVQGER